MGIVSKPRLEDYWAKHSLFGTPGFGEIMSHDHFKQILRCLAFYDVDDADVDDPLYKIRRLISHVVTTSLKLYEPEQYLTIDESMIKFNGRSRMKVYMPSKPIKYGFKVYMMTDASNSYVLSWMLHEGPGESLISIVQRVTEGFESRGFIICMDRFYTTIDVVKDLTSKGFGVYAVIQKNRIHGSKSMKNSLKKLEVGESKFYLYENQNILLTCWRDSKVLLLISNTGDDYIVTVVRNRNIKNRGVITYQKNEIDCPGNIRIYASNSRGVDRFDQVISYYTVDHKSVK